MAIKLSYAIITALNIKNKNAIKTLFLKRKIPLYKRCEVLYLQIVTKFKHEDFI